MHMGSKLPTTVEKKKGFTISIEPSWKQRFLIACHNKSRMEKKPIIRSALVRDFIIQTTIDFENYIEAKREEKHHLAAHAQ